MTTETLTDRELNAYLTEHLFRLRVCRHSCEHTRFDGLHQHQTPGHDEHWSALFTPYSSTGDGMLLVLEAMRGQGFVMVVDAWALGGWRCRVWRAAALHDGYERPLLMHPMVTTYAGMDSLPHAVAEAAQATLEADHAEPLCVTVVGEAGLIGYERLPSGARNYEAPIMSDGLRCGHPKRSHYHVGHGITFCIHCTDGVAMNAHAFVSAETTDQRIDNEAIFQHGKVPGFTGFTMET